MTRAQAERIRTAILQVSGGLPDGDAAGVPELFPAWRARQAYEAGERVQSGGVLYRCLTAHTAQEDWPPEAAVSLWARVLVPDPEEVPAWVQPDSTNPYSMGDRVTHGGKTWESTVDNNVWEPGVYGWQEVTT